MDERVDNVPKLTQKCRRITLFYISFCQLSDNKHILTSFFTFFSHYIFSMTLFSLYLNTSLPTIYIPTDHITICTRNDISGIFP